MKKIFNGLVIAFIAITSLNAGDSYKEDIKRFKSGIDIAGHKIKTYYVDSQKEMIKQFYQLKRKYPNKRFKVINKSNRGVGASMVNYGTKKEGKTEYSFMGLNFQKGEK